MAKDLTPKDFKIIPLKRKILPDEGSEILGGRIGGPGSTPVSDIDKVIDEDGKVDAGQIGGEIPSTNLDIALQGWTTTTVFSATDADTVAWAGGTLTTANGTDYSITGANTGDMTAITYIYLDIGVSTTLFQTSTTATDAVGDGKILVAVAEDKTDEAFFQVFGGIGGTLLSANSIAANAIVANNINVANLSAINADLGSITAGTIDGITITGGTLRTATSGDRIEMNVDGINVVGTSNLIQFWPGGTIGDGDGWIISGQPDGITFEGELIIAGRLTPGFNDLYDIGTPSIKWQNLHLSEDCFIERQIRLTPRATAVAEAGSMMFYSTTNRLLVHDGTSWRTVSWT